MEYEKFPFTAGNPGFQDGSQKANVRGKKSLLQS